MFVGWEKYGVCCNLNGTIIRDGERLLLSDLICLFFAYGEISDIFTTFLTSPGQMTGVFHIDCTLVDRIYLNQHQ